jgi:glyoxylase-like metal-dependent hydrolase (beta-lactamase superfamily II)
MVETPPVRLLDLHHLGNERVIGSYLLETADGPALNDCGPSTTIPGLKAGLAAHGLELHDVRHLLLSHIHLDHAGAAGALVREHQGLQVHVSEIGAPHLIDPRRLESSARRLYGEAFDTLWGELAPVPEENVHVVGERVLGFDCFRSPGHASHHVCYLDPAEGTLLAGDAAGVRIQPASFVLPPTPPPDIDLEAWERTLLEIERRAPQRLALIHFGVADDVDRHLAELRERLGRWAERVRDGLGEEEFVAAAEAELPEGELQLYEHAVPPWQCYLGLRRYWDKRIDAAPGS